ncbi:MAG TPA: radical SAM protein [Bacteroidia bacterium]|nr:radical SAM protein [Bacteroidia bacterium]
MNRNLKDGLNFISKLTPRRLYNIVKVTVSYFVSKVTKKPVHWGNPISISIEPTTACNLRCPQCPSGLRAFSRPTGMLQGDLYKGVLDRLAPDLSYLILYFQGEPYLNTGFLDMVEYAHQKNIYTATSTNAHYLDDANARRTVESGLDRIIISIDGVTEETYKKYRIGGKLDKVLEGTRNLVKWKRELKSSTPHIIWQFIVFSHNEHEIPEVKRLSKEYGVDELGIKTAQVYDYETGSDLIPGNEEYSRYKKVAAGFSIKNALLNHCWKLWHSCVITWDGLVVPCCFDKDATHQLGDLKYAGFNEVWRGEKYVDFRQKVLKGRANIDICKNCTEGTAVWK